MNGINAFIKEALERPLITSTMQYLSENLAVHDEMDVYQIPFLWYVGL
jgi:hypothetical protein